MTRKKDGSSEDYDIFNDDESKALMDVMNNQDIDKFIEMVKLSNEGNHDVLDLNFAFIEQHENGVEMFLKTAIKLEPKNPQHHYNYALFLETQRAYKRAQSEFEFAIELDKNNDIFHTEYANLLFLIEDFQGAEEQYKAALGLNPDNVHVWTNLGRLYYENRQPDKAEKALKKAININPKFPLSYINLLQVYKYQGEKNKENAVLKKYKTINDEIIDINQLKSKNKKSK
jgi:tetratricopeptide (TPR) repeat protein